jgi:hypothetical protein
VLDRVCGVFTRGRPVAAGLTLASLAQHVLDTPLTTLKDLVLLSEAPKHLTALLNRNPAFNLAIS